MQLEKKTAIYAQHLALGGKMVPFAGYSLPVQYQTGIIAEHMAVRTQAGLFDVSHMGEFFISGEDSLENLQYLLTNDFTDMEDGQVRYSPMCCESGGVVDDLIVYRLGEKRYMLVVNASNREKDAAWIRRHLTGDAAWEDKSDLCSEFALQGPAAKEILARLADEIPEKYYTFLESKVAGVPCLISRTGYTGELGYELYLSSDRAPFLWDALLEAGRGDGLIPCGLGARDTLRLEAGMPLYGHEMDETISPLETGLAFAVKLAKPRFIGREALLAQSPPKRRRIGLAVTGRGIVREGCPLYRDGALVGTTTSGTMLPHLGFAAAMALADADQDLAPGTEVEADVRGRRIPAKVVPLPFYKRSN